MKTSIIKNRVISVEAVLTLKPASDSGRNSPCFHMDIYTRVKTVFEETIVKRILPRERTGGDHWPLERNLLDLASSALIGTVSISSSLHTQPHE